MSADISVQAKENKRVERVLIASANPLFGKGLKKLIQKRWGIKLASIRLTTTTAHTLSVVDKWRPEIVLIDYDDTNISRAEILQQFVAGDHPMQVMLVSLQVSGAVVVYDRRTLTPDQAQDWLNLSNAAYLPPSNP